MGGRAMMLKMTGVFLALVAMVMGCLGPRVVVMECQIRIGNHSAGDITEVRIDPDGHPLEFGFFDPSMSKGKIAAGCLVRFHDGFAISWEEKGVAKKALIDVAKYEAKRQEIRCLNFYYLGDSRWQVVAQDGLFEDSRVIQ
jgi:hypothetical protein